MTGLWRYFSSDGITDITDFSIIDVHATQAQGIQKNAYTPLPSFGSKLKLQC